MKRLLWASLFLVTNLSAATLVERLGYPADAKLLIIHGDDLGMSHSVNRATLTALEAGNLSSASIMVPTPWFAEVATWARSHPTADLGLHLTLTSEWTTLRWSPVLRLRSLTDASGYLYLTETDAAKNIDPKEAAAEIREQIRRAKAAGIRPTHLDSHMGTLYQTRELFAVWMRIAREEKIPARISRNHAQLPHIASQLRPDDIVIDRIVSIGSDVPAEKWTEYYNDAIRNLPPGVTEFVVHLGYDDEEMRGATADHPNWGAAWRQRDFSYFMSDEFQRVMRENNVTLIQFRDLAKLLAR
jgi:predicted glycoside hydrolase/deacetylase ChbG (UPF0249 family)